MINNKFTVTYAIKRLNSIAGEFSNDTVTIICKTQSVTNETRDIFIDLFELHKSEYITGIEILAIEENSLHSQHFIKGSFSFKRQLMASI